MNKAIASSLADIFSSVSKPSDLQGATCAMADVLTLALHLNMKITDALETIAIFKTMVKSGHPLPLDIEIREIND